MIATELLQKIGDSLSTSANVKSVYGEPIHMEGKTVVPIAKVAYGFGAGGGTNRGKSGESSPDAEGGGGGGGVRAFPAGALEITANHTRFIPFHEPWWLPGSFAAGALIGALLWRKSR
jgi:uncharacterized spore protein YtfJ